jgi:hypothetical protein
MVRNRWWREIVCFKPDGSITRTVEVPVPIITSVMFGGDNLDVMYATSIGEKGPSAWTWRRRRQPFRYQRVGREGGNPNRALPSNRFDSNRRDAIAWWLV